MFRRFRVLFLFPLFAISCNLFRSDAGSDKDEITDYDSIFTTPEYLYEGETWTGPSEILYSAYKGSETRTWDLVHTRLALEFNFDQRSCKGTARLALRAHSWDTLRSLELDAAGMDISSVLWIDTQFADHKFYKTEDITGTSLVWDHSDSTHLIIRLPEPCLRNRVITVEIEYTAFPYRQALGGNDAISGDRGMYFINHDLKEPGKPRQIWTQGETQSSSRWFPTLDAPNQKTTLDISLTVPDTMVTLSNGLQVSSAPAGIPGFRTDRWVQKAPHAPYLTMVAVGNWSVVKDVWRGREVNYLVEKTYEPYAKLIFGNTPAMIEFFSNYLGVEYPWDKYSQVVVRDFVSGAMENTTATVHMEQLQHMPWEHNDNTYEDYVSHELFHQWFGDLVTTESWSNITLNESFATYGEYLWREHHYGLQNAEGLLSELRDQYRMYGIPEGKHLVRYQFENEGELFDNVSYQKGACILHMLRRTIGEAAFRESLKQYLTKFRHKTAEVADFRMVVEEVTGRDMNWFFNQWYFDGDHPGFYLSLEKGGTGNWMLRVEQHQQHRNTYAFPVKIAYSVKGKIKEQNLFAGHRLEFFDLGTTDKPDWYIFDSDNSLLCDEDIIYKDMTEARYSLQMINRAWEYGSGGNRLRLFEMASKIAGNLEDTMLQNSMEPEIRELYLKAMRSGDETVMVKAMEFSGGNPAFGLVIPTADGESLDGLVYSVARNIALRPETRKTALAQLYYSGMNSKALINFTRDSSIAVATYAIGYLYDQSVWEPFATQYGLKYHRGAVASAWARKLIIYGKGSPSEHLRTLADNTAVDPDQFTKALNAMFYYAPIDIQISSSGELAQKLSESGRPLMLATLLYRLNEELRSIDAEISEMDDHDPDLIRDLAMKKTALEEIIDKYGKR